MCSEGDRLNPNGSCLRREGHDGKNGKYWRRVKDNSEMDRRTRSVHKQSWSAASFHV